MTAAIDVTPPNAELATKTVLDLLGRGEIDLGRAIDLTISLGAIDPNGTLLALEASKEALLRLEPIVAALRSRCGKPPRANKIVAEIAKDVEEKIERAVKYGGLPPASVGVYSDDAVACGKGTSFYLAEDGRVVEVTSVVNDINAYGWKDKVVLGRVLCWLKPGIHGHSPYDTEAWRAHDEPLR